MNYKIVQDALTGIGSVVADFISKNKNKIVMALPSFALAGVLGYDAYKSNKQHEKDRLYQKHIQETDSVIQDLKKQVRKVERLEEINEVLTDTVIELRNTNLSQA